MSRPFALRLGNIDVTYVRNNEIDDFADLERLFLLLEAPVRNPTNLGWVLAITRLARAAGTPCAARRPVGQFHHQLVRLVAERPITCCRGGCITAYRQWRMYYRNSSELALGRLSQAVHRAVGAGEDRELGASTTPRDCQAVDASMRRSAPNTPPRWESMPARARSVTTFSIVRDGASGRRA